MLSSQILGATGRGSVALIATNIVIAVVVSGFVGGASLMHLLEKYTNQKYTLRILTVSYFWAAISSSLIAFLALQMEWVHRNFILDTFFLGLLAAMTAINSLVALNNKNIIFYNSITLIQVGGCLIFFYLSSIFIGKVEINNYIHSLYVSHILSFLISTGLIFKYFFKLEKESDGPKVLESVFEIFKIGALSQISNLFLYATYRVSYYVLGAAGALNEVGIYSVGVMISEIVWIVSGSFAIVLFVHATKSKNDKDLPFRAIRYMKICFFISISFVVVLLLIPKIFYILIFGNQFGDVKITILYLSGAMICASVSTILNHYFAGIGMFFTNAVVALIGLIFSLILNLFLIPKFGFIGAAITSSTIGLLILLLFLHQFLKQTKVDAKKLIPKFEDFKEFHQNTIRLFQTFLKNKGI